MYASSKSTVPLSFSKLLYSILPRTNTLSFINCVLAHFIAASSSIIFSSGYGASKLTASEYSISVGLSYQSLDGSVIYTVFDGIVSPSIFFTTANCMLSYNADGVSVKSMDSFIVFVMDCPILPPSPSGYDSVHPSELLIGIGFVNKDHFVDIFFKEL